MKDLVLNFPVNPVLLGMIGFIICCLCYKVMNSFYEEKATKLLKNLYKLFFGGIFISAISLGSFYAIINLILWLFFEEYQNTLLGITSLIIFFFGFSIALYVMIFVILNKLYGSPVISKKKAISLGFMDKEKTSEPKERNIIDTIEDLDSIKSIKKFNDDFNNIDF